MQNNKSISSIFGKIFGRNRGNLVQDILFFIMFYIYLWLIVGPHLIYHSVRIVSDFPVFFWGWDFFREIIIYPGGPIKYVAAFLFQLFHFSWAGAFIITFQAWLICLFINKILKTINASFLLWSRFIPPILLLIIYSRYTNYLATTMAFLTALFFIYVYMQKAQNSRLARSVIFLIMSIMLYYLAGATLLYFGLVCIIYDLFIIKSWKSALIYLIYIFIIPYIGGILIFNTSITEAFSELLPLSYTVLDYETHADLIEIMYFLYLYLPLFTVGFGLWNIHINKFGLSSNEPPVIEAVVNRITKKQNLKLFSWHNNRPVVKWIIESTVLFMIAGAAVVLSHDYKAKTIFEVDYYAYHKIWPKVLVVYKRYPWYDFVIHAVNRALYHTGRFPYDMFSCPQDYKHISSLLLTTKKHKDNNWEKFGVYIDLGFINWAEYKLNESMAQYGPRHIILKRLAIVSMVKGKIHASRVYLGALTKTLFYSGWANKYLDKIKVDPTLSTDKEVQQLRSLMMKRDYILTSFNGEKMLLDLLAANRTNRMAFEYLMAYYMLSLQLDRLTQNLYRLDDFNYPQIPELYEEAVLVYKARTQKSVEVHGRNLSLRTVERFEAFTNVIRCHGSNINSARQELLNEFGDSFLFYSMYGFSGIINEKAQNNF